MSQCSKQAILGLYKSLLRYSKGLKLTDPIYYQERIRSEFRKNQTLTDSKDVEFYYKVKCLGAQS